jgi:hypothetical protein
MMDTLNAVSLFAGIGGFLLEWPFDTVLKFTGSGSYTA